MTTSRHARPRIDLYRTHRDGWIADFHVARQTAVRLDYPPDTAPLDVRTAMQQQYPEARVNVVAWE